jgi:hypothetical protein
MRQKVFHILVTNLFVPEATNAALLAIEMKHLLYFSAVSTECQT